MPYYESVFIARQDISSLQVEEIMEKMSSIITESGGTVAKSEYWGLKTLAYRIKKNRKGHYMMLNIDASASAVKELERNMSINDDILRLMTIKLSEINETPSIMMQSKRTNEDGRNGKVGSYHEFRPKEGVSASDETLQNTPNNSETQNPGPETSTVDDIKEEEK